MHKNIHIIYKVPNYLKDWCLGFSMQLDKYLKKLSEKNARLHNETASHNPNHIVDTSYTTM